jgi:uncharacterized membrane protein (Fun14 family)
LGVLDEIFKFITSGNIGGIPTFIVMILPFILGLIVGYFLHKFLKIAIIAAIILFVASYLGFFSLSLSTLEDLSNKYGSMAIHYVTLLIGILPLGIGFIIGAIIGFVFS